MKLVFPERPEIYGEFTKRIFTVISILAFIIIFLIIMVVSEGERHGPLMGLTYGAVTAVNACGAYTVLSDGY